jgi:CRP-like cAMP-binding protein
MPELNDIPECEIFLAMMAQIAPLPEPLKTRFKQYLRTDRLPKKHVLLRPGEVSRRIYFIISGFARAYFLDQNGREKTTWFMSSGDVMISVYSFFTREKAMEYIDLLEDSCLLSISWRQLQLVYQDFPEFNLLGRLLTEKYYVLSEQRMILLRMRKPEERYRFFLKIYTSALQRVPQHIIASFLELTPETLSRVRSKQAKIDLNQRGY